MGGEKIVDFYERHALEFDRDRGRTLQEKAWLDRFLSRIRPGGRILDVGCGTGEPIARYVREAGYGIVGVDSSPSMILLCRSRFPSEEWVVADMRRLALERRFDGLLAWDSFFHLELEDQSAALTRFAAHCRPGAPLMFTSGPVRGEAIGSLYGESLYHASYDPDEYRALLAANGFTVVDHLANDGACGDHTVWLATYRTAAGED